MTLPKNDFQSGGGKSRLHYRPWSLSDIVQIFNELVARYERDLLLSLRETNHTQCQENEEDNIEAKARRLAMCDLSISYARRNIWRSLSAVESLGKSAEERLRNPIPNQTRRESLSEKITSGYFRLYSPQLFDLLGQPTDLKFGTLRFHKDDRLLSDANEDVFTSAYVELAINSSFFVGDSNEMLPYHSFSIPDCPSLTNRGILTRRPEDGGSFPGYDSWVLFTFLAEDCLKVEIPVEMCADAYPGYRAALGDRENEEIVFWGLLMEDNT
ncbi:uncharacterized protein EI97DRAFT_17295 [Westerdykella ornata]|uniref:Uncharacterized protein n=1 Tax=Westerdykella ornata TaxID=318751 RepID=A0A6A6JYQ9_WESOR|nr:uncharacterized protein EI97DRAFT_17295 [Westerdykella ornata]KAF2280988.1 hypothetical protein EI97DRAFT_17295 [Westerdykella ornata]